MLTSSQYTVLGEAINADPNLTLFVTNGQDNAIRAYMNELTTAVVWRENVKLDDILKGGFDWSQVDNMTNGQARIWQWMFDNDQRSINPSDPDVRDGISECWKGTAGKVAVGVHVLSRCKRFATRTESFFAAGGKTTANPGTLVFIGDLSDADIARALRG